MKPLKIEQYEGLVAEIDNLAKNRKENHPDMLSREEITYLEALQECEDILTNHVEKITSCEGCNSQSIPIWNSNGNYKHHC